MNKSSSHRLEAQHSLLSLYEDESEWEQALNVARQLLPKRILRQRTEAEQRIATRMGLYYCELAELALAKSDIQAAIEYVAKSRDVDRNNLRATYLKACIEARRGDKAAVFKLLPLILRKDSKLLFEGLWLIGEATKGSTPQQVASYLQTLYQDTGSATVLEMLLAITPEAGSRQLEQHVERKPSAKAIGLWLRHSGALAALPEPRQQLMQQFVANIHDRKKRYQCNHCGFAGMNFFWHCPTCRQWDTIELKRGEELD